MGSKLQKEDSLGDCLDGSPPRHVKYFSKKEKRESLCKGTVARKIPIYQVGMEAEATIVEEKAQTETVAIFKAIVSDAESKPQKDFLIPLYFQKSPRS